MYEYMGQLLLGKEKKIKSKRKESRHARGTRWIGENLARVRLTRLKSAQQPPPSLRARCCLTYLKYKCSKSRKAAARRIPIINKRKADKNCSSARGSLLFCTSLPGLHVPVIQYLLSRSKSPAIFFSFQYSSL